MKLITRKRRDVARGILAGGFALGAILGLSLGANAALVDGPDIIAAPASVVNRSADGGATNDHQQGFDERQGVTLTAPLAVDGRSIPAGTTVDSHMIFLNVPDDAAGTNDYGQTWTFSGPILGVISDTPGTLLAASDPILGAPNTIYPGAFPSRGLETNVNGGAGPGDGYSVVGNSITVGMIVTQPGDWIRVVTLAVPTSDAQCKDGGWRTYLIAGEQLFQNQGDCVSFVETNGKNEPGQNVPTSQE